MEKAVSAKTMAAIDENSQEQYGIPGIVLMERAGLLAWKILREYINPDMSVVFLAGGGNNGGDALVMAREAFMEGFDKISVIACGSRISPSCATNRGIIHSLGLPFVDIGTEEPGASVEAILREADVIVDGLSGTGLSGPLRGNAATLVSLVASVRKTSREILKETRNVYVCSIDVPSGVGDDVPASAPVMRADRTITMGMMKYALLLPAFREACGELSIVNPGFPPIVLDAAQDVLHVADSEDFSLRPLDLSAYKKNRGHIAVFAGSEHYSGAAGLACMAAFHARCGLVTLYADKNVQPLIARENPSIITRTISSGEIASIPLEAYDAILAGPGWGRGGDREDILAVLLDTASQLVIDADGLHVFASLVKKDSGRAVTHCPLVLTPHPGELKILYDALPSELRKEDISDASPCHYKDILTTMSSYYQAVIIAKSHVTWIADGSRVYVVEGRDPSLGVAGSGDVLAGTCAASMAAHATDESLAASALDAVLVHRNAGRRARETYGWYAAEDIVTVLGNAFDALAEARKGSRGIRR
ncbi:NAD(P)H-hydrate epimerase [Parasphaerochaeta coccoides]|uniref:Bifunctional NAD(P)H-hydrate repair enzyme n=1 Tax=Parasphaerochaeta coccoides (strain ATCC BAA-1237 / DSM 17374 / SPN1) TaxID=760011 RepID=F4GIM8_PARC1|nr:NAD(P)H-hydrate epimerase [Parasphaerochaeta coccoides]AEC02162.1 YjeF-related protein [Parasphaerochaeta coccoides DSM 17374]